MDKASPSETSLEAELENLNSWLDVINEALEGVFCSAAELLRARVAGVEQALPDHAVSAGDENE